MSAPQRRLSLGLASVVRRRYISASARQGPLRTRIQHDGFSRPRPLGPRARFCLADLEEHGRSCPLERDLLGGHQGVGLLPISRVER
jgi:hypothetical protein